MTTEILPLVARLLVRRLLITCLLGAACAPQPTPPHPNYPAAIPASCPVATLRFERRQGFEAYWIDGVTLAAGLPTGILRDGENKIQWQGDPGELVVGGRSLDGSGEVQLVDPTRIGVGIYSTSTVFPHPGCWRLTATMGTGSFDAAVFVFPK
jgi:hypothetical protein